MPPRKITFPDLIDQDPWLPGWIWDNVDHWRHYRLLQDEHAPGWTAAGARSYARSTDTCEWCHHEAPLVLDHCHGCGRNRGWLCHDCNKLEGRGLTIGGWPAKCDGQSFYLGRDWSNADVQPQRCGGTDAFAEALRDWWREVTPKAFPEHWTR